jgi:hypothetical protein
VISAACLSSFVLSQSIPQVLFAFTPSSSMRTDPHRSMSDSIVSQLVCIKEEIHTLRAFAETAWLSRETSKRDLQPVLHFEHATALAP